MNQPGLSSVEQFFVANIETALIEVGLCYFTRPFRDGKGGTRFLSANEFYFAFAEDFGLVPDIVTRSECHNLIYKTIDHHPEFSGIRCALLSLLKFCL